MKIVRTLIAAGIALAAAPALAAFQTLPTTGERVLDRTELEINRLFIPTGPVAGPIIGPDGVPGNAYNFPNPATWVLISEIRESDVLLPEDDELEEVGEFFDAVFRDTSDNSLIFMTRLVLEEEGEINDIFRSGFFGYEVQAAWTFSTDFDLRMFSAARSNVNFLTGPDVFDPDIVNMRSDINVDEGSPWSGLYFLKVAAPGFYLKPDAIRIYQAGEEVGDEPFSFYLDGYAPLPVPEPSTYAMLLGGLGLLAFAAKRRRGRAA